jgi:hypothetical protein
MQISKSSLMLLTFTMLIGSVSAQTTTFNPKASRWVNSDCKKTNSCDLKSFELKTTDFRIDLPDSPTFGTLMSANYETKDAATLEKYGLVQYVHGCQYISVKENNVVKKYPVIKIQHFGEEIPYFFPKMVIDGWNTDPLSWSSDLGLSRHFNYFTKEQGIGRERNSKQYHGVNPATEGKLYVVDQPGLAAYYPDSERAYNMSVKYKLCLHKAKDVPIEVKSDKVHLPNAIHCMEWSTSFIYDHFKEKYESKSEIDPHCLDPKSSIKVLE